MSDPVSVMLMIILLCAPAISCFVAEAKVHDRVCFAGPGAAKHITKILGQFGA